MAGSFLFLFVIASVVGLAWLWSRVLGRQKVRVPSCGSCGYAVRALEVMTCPECGSDLREVGIITPRSTEVRPIAFVALWTLLFVFPGMLIGGLLLHNGPRRIQSWWSTSITSPAQSFPALSLVVNAAGSAPRGASGTSTSTSRGPSGTTSTITYPPLPGGDATVTVELSATGGSATPHTISLSGNPGPIDVAALEAWAAGLPGATPGPELTADTADIARLIDGVGARQTSYTTTRLGVGGMSTMTRRTVPAWYGFVVGGVPVAIYAGGLAIFFTIRRRRRAGGAEPQPPPA